MKCGSCCVRDIEWRAVDIGGGGGGEAEAWL